MPAKTAQITVTVSVDLEDVNVFVTAAPYFLVIDPQRLKAEMAHHMDSYDIEQFPDIENDALVSIIARSVRGPFFTPESALEALRVTRQEFGTSHAAIPYCLSGVCNPEYSRNYCAAREAISGEHGT